MNRLLLVILLLLCAVNIYGEDSKSEQTLRFIYIAHDHTTPIPELVERITTIKNDVDKDDDPGPLVVYLASGSHPIVIRMNVKEGLDNPEDFDNVLLAELYERSSHDVDPETDVYTIMNIFDDIDFLDEQNKLKYSSAYFQFFVTPSFWSSGFNETVIVPIFFGLDLPEAKNKNQYLNVEVLQPRKHPVQYVKGKPFGDKNVGGINEHIKTITFID